MKWLKEVGDDLVPIDMFEANDLMGQPALRRVALDVTDDWTLSTVFLGYDNSLGMGTPECYQTALKRPNGRYETVLGYATRRQAERGHAGLLRLLQGPTAGLFLAALGTDVSLDDAIRRCHVFPERDKDHQGGDGDPCGGDRGGDSGGMGAAAGDEPQSDP